MTYFFASTLTVLLFFSACKKQDNTSNDTITGSTKTSNIVITAYQYVSTQAGEVLYNNVTVELYNSSADRAARTNKVDTKKTSTNGKVEFTGLKLNQYYVLGVDAHTVKKEVDVSTPLETVSYEELHY
jgi:hypothetical protein